MDKTDIILQEIRRIRRDLDLVLMRLGLPIDTNPLANMPPLPPPHPWAFKPDLDDLMKPTDWANIPPSEIFFNGKPLDEVMARWREHVTVKPPAEYDHETVHDLGIQEDGLSIGKTDGKSKLGQHPELVRELNHDELANLAAEDDQAKKEEK